MLLSSNNGVIINHNIPMNIMLGMRALTVWLIFDSINGATTWSETLDENPSLFSVQSSTVALNSENRRFF